MVERLPINRLPYPIHATLITGGDRTQLRRSLSGLNCRALHWLRATLNNLLLLLIPLVLPLHVSELLIILIAGDLLSPPLLGRAEWVLDRLAWNDVLKLSIFVELVAWCLIRDQIYLLTKRVSRAWKLQIVLALNDLLCALRCIGSQTCVPKLHNLKVALYDFLIVVQGVHFSLDLFQFRLPRSLLLPNNLIPMIRLHPLHLMVYTVVKRVIESGILWAQIIGQTILKLNRPPFLNHFIQLRSPQTILKHPSLVYIFQPGFWVSFQLISAKSCFLLLLRGNDVLLEVTVFVVIDFLMWIGATTHFYNLD